MPGKKGNSKGKSHRGKSRKRRVDFPILSIGDVLNPFADAVQARHARQKVFRLLVKNKPVEVRNHPANGTSGTVIPRPVPAVADVDEFLIEMYEQTYHSDPKAKPKTGEENDRGKVAPARDGGRLNTLSVKELQKVIINLNRNRKKIVVSAGLAAAEKTQLFNQLVTSELQLKSKKQTCETFNRAKEDLNTSIKHTERVYKEKLKATQSEYHQTLFDAKTAHLTYFLEKQKSYWRQEKDQHEELIAAGDSAAYDKLLLDRIGKDVNQEEIRRRQGSKENYLMVLQSQLENFELFVNDTQDEVDGKVKVHARFLDKLKQSNFDGMMVSQDKTVSEMKKFFQGVNTANSNIIYQLKSDVNRRRARLDRLERDVFTALEENAKILIPLHRMNVEVAEYEKRIEGVEQVRAGHQRLWAKAKKLEEHVLRLKWRKELAVDRREKSAAQNDQLQKVYSETSMDIARKAGLAELIHNKTCSLLEEELTIYNMAHLIMHGFTGMDFNGTPQSDAKVRQLIEQQEKCIFDLKIQGQLLRRKYDRSRSLLLSLFQRKFLRSLESTGFHILTLEERMSDQLRLFNGVPDDLLSDIENQTDTAAIHTVKLRHSH